MTRLLLASLLLVGCKADATQTPGSISVQPPVQLPISANAPRAHDGDGFSPEHDRDSHGLLDAIDNCIDGVENRNGYQDSDGCPDEIPNDLASILGVMHGVEFEYDKWVLRVSSFPVLDRAIEVLKQYPDVRIEISSHVASTGSEEYGRSPTGKRADTIKRYFVEHGIDAARLETRGFGPDKPIDTNKTAQGRAKNLRVELTILVQ